MLLTVEAFCNVCAASLVQGGLVKKDLTRHDVLSYRLPAGLELTGEDLLNQTCFESRPDKNEMRCRNSERPVKLSSSYSS